MKSKFDVTVVVTNLQEIKQLTKEIETQIQQLNANVSKLNEMGLQFQVKPNM